MNTATQTDNNRCDDVWNGKRCCLPAGHDECHDNTGQSVDDREPDDDCFYCYGNGVQPNGDVCPLGCKGI